METTLVAVTVVSLALASTMGVLVWRLVAMDRRREAARVAALSALAADDAADYADRMIAVEPIEAADYADSANRTVAADYANHADQPAAADSADYAARKLAADYADSADDDRRVVPQPEIFVHEERESPFGRRLVAVAAVAAVMAIAVGTLLFARGSTAVESGGAVQTGSLSPASSRPGAPLELVSLRHERAGDRLTITGLVRNPRGGARVERANAVAFVFDPSGTFIASGRALVDFVTLDPGDESPFVVSVTAPGPIGRYRIGFRRQDGAVVGHVDRRAAI